MIKPNKHTNPNAGILAVSMEMLKLLKRYRVITYSDLLGYVSKKNPSGEILFGESLSLLYVLGVIQYHLKTDSFEYVPKEAV